MGYQLIETIEVGSGGAASIEFTGIDQTGQDLVLLASLRSNNSTIDNANIQVNGVTTSNYSYRFLGGDGGSAFSSQSSTNDSLRGAYGVNPGNHTANTFSNTKFYFSNYSSTSQHKTVSHDVVSENNATFATMSLGVSLYPSNSAIVSLLLFANGTLQQYSTASLYKVTAD